MTYIPGKVVLITGAGMGMGQALSLMFAGDRARLILVDMNESALSQAAAEVKAKGAEVFTYVCDVSDRARVGELKDKVHKDVGLVDILVNNAGIVAAGEFLDVPMEKHIKVMEVNVFGIFYMTAAFLPDMMEKRSGHVVQLASAAGLMGVADLTSYCASKHAVVGFTESLRYEFLKKPEYKDIHFTTVCPSFVATGMFDGAQPPLLTNFLTTEQMVERIYAAVKLNKIIIVAPFLAQGTPVMKALLPTGVFDAIQQFMAVDKSMQTWKGH